MTIYVAGGSNSLIARGWIHHLIELTDEPVVNLAVGATSSRMAAYRALFTVDIQPGDTLVWEYALNDYDHVEIGYFSSDDLLGYVERLILECGRIGAAFVGLILKPPRTESLVHDPPHYRKLGLLFDHHRVAYFDLSATLRVELGVTTLSSAFYEDHAHLLRSPALMDRLARATINMLDAPTPPVCGSPIYVTSSGLAFHEPPRHLTRFTNALLDLGASAPPLVVESVPAGEALVGLVLTTSAAGGAVRVSTRQHTVECSSTYLQRGVPGAHRFTRPLLKIFALDRIVDGAWIIEAEDPVEISWADGLGPFHPNLGMAAELDRTEASGRETLVMGILTEVGPHSTFFGPSS